MKTLENAPALELDKVLYKDGKIPPHVIRERRIVWNLIKHLFEAGWSVVRVHDGEDVTRVEDGKAALELIFNLDDASVGFSNPFVPNSGRTHYVKLVFGNDLEIISDWNYSEGDPDGFNAAMEKFDAEAFA